ncbi:HCP-like protein [Gigaspora margarita]|uniref:HCP-like protein n=1 Tax=Gigaspora margarita TaxID=4874 RepID=A0A8H4A6X7_GIGMA|nr:HCP-like protein [Gigaspora margarita]
MKELHFTIAIANENQRAKDAQKVDQAIEKLNLGIDNKLDILAQRISIIMTKMNIQLGDVPNTNENNLKKTPVGLYKKDSVIRKYYNSIEVACKPIKDSSQNKVELAILGKYKNVFITKNLDPKLGNFQYACETNASTTSFSIQNQLEMFVGWPMNEQIEKYKEYSNKKSYTFSCEMFSELEKLAKHNPIALCAPQLLENNKLDFGITCDTENSKLPKFEDEPINFYENNSLIDPLISVDEGIKFHRNKNYKSAWKCFEENSKLCNPLAQYWQAYYLYYEYFVKQDKEHANQLFKNVADNNNDDDQNNKLLLMCNIDILFH